jgi:Uma2 family endonuclease
VSTVELLEIPEVRDHVSRMSVEEYHLLPERNERGRRTELVRGIVIEKMSKSPRHSWLTQFIYQLIAKVVGDQYVVWMDQPLTFIDSEPEPDIAVVEGTINDRLRGHPDTALLVIEIAVTSLALDRVKADIYAEANIQEYWIVDVSKKQIEVYTKPEDGAYTVKEIYEMEAVIHCQSVPAIELRVGALFP